jgi:hypothetical protein
MSEFTGTQSPIDVSERGINLLCLHQQADSGEDQTILLDLHQAETLANWFTQYVRTAREDISEE